MTEPLPLSDEDWPEECAELLEDFAGKLNVYRVMAHHPELLNAWATLRRHIVAESALGPDLSELVILRTAHRFGSAYEWAHHVSRARKLGMSDARIASMRDEPSGLDGLIAGAVDALLDEKYFSPDLDRKLAETIGREAVFNLIATVGFYSILGYILKSYGTPIDHEIAAEMSANPL